MSEFYVMGTGSRSMVNEPNAKEIYATLERKILQMQDLTTDEIILISGLAEGWDEAIAKVGMRNGIKYIAAVPHPTYGEYYWGKNSQLKRNRMEQFTELVDHATEVVIVSRTLYVNGVHANFVRNQWMVDKCDMALVYKPQSKGTRDAIARLASAKKPWEVYPFIEQPHLPDI